MEPDEHPAWLGSRNAAFNYGRSAYSAGQPVSQPSGEHYVAPVSQASPHEETLDDRKEEPTLSREVSPLVVRNHVMDYAAGLALRNSILVPLSETLKSDQRQTLALELGEYYRGHRALQIEQQQQKKIVLARLGNVSSADAGAVRSWYHNSIDEGGGDCFLSYSSENWSKEWVDRCYDGVNSGFEMIKLVSNVLDEHDHPQDVVLAVALVERHAVDPAEVLLQLSAPSFNEVKEEDLPRATIIHGLRIAPFCNPEVIDRAAFCLSEIDTSVVKKPKITLFPFSPSELLSHLLEEILDRSLLYGTSGVTVHSPKQNMLESFYRSKMGNPVVKDEDGRFVFRLTAKDRMDAIKQGFEAYRALVQDSKSPGVLQVGLRGYSGIVSALATSNSKRAGDSSSRDLVSPHLKKARYGGYSEKAEITVQRSNMSRVVSEGKKGVDEEPHLTHKVKMETYGGDCEDGPYNIPWTNV